MKNAVLFTVFQNISCYCLSSDNASFIVFPSLFQNISCYCLSSLCAWRTKIQTYFKTSHVIVYHFFTIPNTVAFIISIHLMLLFIHIATFRSKGGNIISKHLMLLFIGIGRMLTSRLLHFKTSHVIVYHYAEYEQLVGGVFQNISCYCLSFLAVSV